MNSIVMLLLTLLVTAQLGDRGRASDPVPSAAAAGRPAAPDIASQEALRDLLGRAERERSDEQYAAAARTYAAAARLAPDFADWAWLWTANAAARAADSAQVRRGLDSTSTALRDRYGFAAELEWRERIPDPATARAALELFLAGQTDGDRRARTLLALARRFRTDAARYAREALRAATSAALRAEAAGHLDPTAGTAADARLAGDALLSQGRPAAALRWLNRSDLAPAAAAERASRDLVIGRALFNARLYEEAATRLARVTTGAGAEEALFLRGRSEYRAARYAAGRTHLKAVTTRFPGTPWAVRANHLLGDLEQDDGDLAAARRHFDAARTGDGNVAEAGLAWMRLAALEFQAGRHTEAARLYDEYLTRYPAGRRAEEANYWAGRAHAAAGRDSLATARWQALGDPLSYYTYLAAARLGHPAPALPAAGAATLPLEGQVPERLALLRRFGTAGEGGFEASRLTAGAGAERQARLRLAATLIESGWSVPGIRLAQQVQRADGRATGEVLRLLYPFPYRAAVEREARANGLDPMFVAALIRQESLWDSRATSPVGARGLMQIMPATGRDLWGGAAGWSAEVLYDPETSIRLGTRFLRDLRQQTGGRAVDVLAGYNAGPHRIARWRELPESRDAELLAERIPFEETRHYVKVVQGNEHIYRVLYSPPAGIMAP